ncbi:MAG: YrbL family protein [bacterium]
MLYITSDPIGTGKERTCFVHPEDPRKVIKISTGEVREQSRREIRFYRKLKKRRKTNIPHIPKFYGLCETNLGEGIVVDLIRNYDGEISRPLNWYLTEGYPIEYFESCLVELRQSLLENLIVFHHDMALENLFLQKHSTSTAHLVAIGGLGDAVVLDWLDFFPPLVRYKIRSQWECFITLFYHNQEVRQPREAADSE